MTDLNTSTAENADNVQIVDSLDIEASQMREIGEDAVWSISSAKVGNGIEQLRDNCTDTYWQSGMGID
jgi:anaphase-promoting complex subunit 10